MGTDHHIQKQLGTGHHITKPLGTGHHYHRTTGYCMHATATRYWPEPLTWYIPRPLGTGHHYHKPLVGLGGRVGLVFGLGLGLG